jgi:type II secretory pathway component PulF
MNQPLNERESEQLLTFVVNIGLAQHQLVDGLYAAAADSSNRRVATALRDMAKEVGRGRPFLEVVADPAIRISPHVRGLIAAATRTGKLGVVLDELLEHHRAHRALISNIWFSLVYPMFVLMLTLCLLGFFMIWVVPEFDAMFVEFALDLPILSLSLIQVSRASVALWTQTGIGSIVLAGIIALGIGYLATSGRGGAGLQRALEMAPILGPLWCWSGAADFLRMLSLMLDNHVPLPEALKLAADGSSKADLRRAGRWLSQQVSEGRQLADLVESSHCLPATSPPVLRWGERTGLLSDAAKTLADMYSDRVRLRTNWLRSALPPIVYLMIVSMVVAAVLGLFLPLVNLFRALL